MLARCSWNGVCKLFCKVPSALLESSSSALSTISVFAHVASLSVILHYDWNISQGTICLSVVDAFPIGKGRPRENRQIVANVKL